MPSQPTHRASAVHDVLDPTVPFPGGHNDRVTIELPCIRIIDEESGEEWYDICLSLRGGGEMAVVDLPTRLTVFQTMPADLWRDFLATTQGSILFQLMDVEERFGVQTLLNVYAYLAENQPVAEAAWDEFVSQLEVAAVVSSIHRAMGGEHEEQAHEEPEHANRLVFGLGFWASGQWPDKFPRPKWDEEEAKDAEVDREHDQVELGDARRD